MTIISEAFNGVVVRGLFIDKNEYGKDFCEIEVMTFHRVTGTGGAGNVLAGAVRMRIFSNCVSEVVSTSFADNRDGLGFHNGFLNDRLADWNKLNASYKSDDAIVIQQKNGDKFSFTPDLHPQLLQVFAITQARLDQLEEDASGESKMFFHTLGLRFFGLIKSRWVLLHTLTGIEMIF